MTVFINGIMMAMERLVNSWISVSSLLASVNLSSWYSSALYARTTRKPVRFSRATRLMLSVRRCMALNFGMTKLMITPITASSTATAMPVANVHSRPLFAILHTAHTAMIGALISIIRPMVTNIWICVMSFVERVMSDAVEKRFISAGPKLSTFLNSSERRRWLNDAPTRAAMKPVTTAHATDPSETSSILPPAIQMSLISLPGVSTSCVMSAM